ncbi:MAG TPA: UDP-3-O-acyl-N-acetylglucosamine deacetylase [Bacillota bacterium]|nr:UDP-3-O-acyl-N-acetylglucosamine deacetylase [Bacillota bacterium]
MKYQKTIAAEVIIAGKALHKGILVTMRLLPQPANTGISFRRIDLPGKPQVKAEISSVVDTKRSVTIGKDGWIISTIEHLLAVFQGLEIDNVLVEVDGEELPTGDGSGHYFAEQILKVGLVDQDCLRNYTAITEPTWVSGVVYKGNEPLKATLVALPSDQLEVSFTFTSDHKITGTQYYHFMLSPDNFMREIASARTIAFTKEIEYLRSQGLAQSDDINCVVLVGENGYENELRYPEEIVRHKILDVLGDLYLLGPLKAHIVAVRSGHTLDLELAKAIVAHTRAN